MLARDMVPGKTYMGTEDGPQSLTNVAFTVLATASYDNFNPHLVPHDDGGEESCILIAALHAPPFEGPFETSTAFSPGDWVIEVPTDTNDPWLCGRCRYAILGEDPDMGTGHTWKPGTCEGCKRTEVITFKYSD